MVQRAQLDHRLRGTPGEKATGKRINRWINVWSPVLTACSPVALDLANHEWGRHETHTLILTIEPTDSNEDAELFRATDAVIRSYTEILKLVPDLEPAVTNVPETLKWPRLHCFIFVKHEDYPKQLGRVRLHSWCTPSLREVYSQLDKNYSRAVAQQALPLLLNEINGPKDPHNAMRKFRIMGECPGALEGFLDVLGTGVGIIDDEDMRQLFRWFLDRVLSGVDEEEPRSES